MSRLRVRWELVDWSPARHPPILLHQQKSKWRRRSDAFLCNMCLRKVGTRYIHKGRKP